MYKKPAALARRTIFNYFSSTAFEHSQFPKAIVVINKELKHVGTVVPQIDYTCNGVQDYIGRTLQKQNNRNIFKLLHTVFHKNIYTFSWNCGSVYVRKAERSIQARIGEDQRHVKTCSTAYYSVLTPISFPLTQTTKFTFMAYEVCIWYSYAGLSWI